MTDRLVRFGILAALLLGGASAASAQFMPSPVQGSASGVFPPPPGQNQAARQDQAFPPPPGAPAAQRQDSAFPPAPGGPAAQRQDAAFPPPSGPSGGRPAVVGGSGPGPAPGAFSNPAQKACLEFPTMRDDVAKAFSQIKAASDRKVGREVACPLFKAAALKEEKMLKFLESNQKLCGVPPQVITQVKGNHTQTLRVRDQICSNKPGPAAGPSLSDALGAPIIADDSNSGKPGRGTFDTLTGNVLAR